MIQIQVAKMATALAMVGMAACAASEGSTSGERNDVAGAVAPEAADAVATAAVKATKITIKSDQPLAMVAYREVTDPVWHAATEVTSGTFVAQVRGPYWVVTACQAPQPGMTSRFTQIWRAGRTLDDAHEITTPFVCYAQIPKPLPEVKGVMTQGADQIGTIAIGNDQIATQFNGLTAQFPYALSVPKGAYTMYGYNGDRIAIRHGVTVAKTMSVAPLDLLAEGAPYEVTPFVAVNASPFSYQHAVTRVADPGSKAFSGDLPFNVVDVALPGRTIPSSLLTTDNQTVSVQADIFTSSANVSRNENLSSRRPWRSGDDLVFSEPPQIGGAAWSYNELGQLRASWTSLPPATIFTADVGGFSLFGDWVDDFTEMSQGFLAATNPTSVVIDTSLPDFQVGWMIVYTPAANGYYARTLIAQDVTNRDDPERNPIYTSDITEWVFPATTAATAAAQIARAAGATTPARPVQARMPQLPGLLYAP